uniref:Cytochrome c oxidase assembly protein COX16 homolog, mitochondrial n=1 Tax=Steinernema glaseri TaxID=37863 RepID=A0A1I8ATK9_9BILA
MSRRGNLKFIRVGLPFFSIVFGGAFGLHYFQQVRFDFRKIKKTDDNLEFLVRFSPFSFLTFVCSEAI